MVNKQREVHLLKATLYLYKRIDLKSTTYKTVDLSTVGMLSVLIESSTVHPTHGKQKK